MTQKLYSNVLRLAHKTPTQIGGETELEQIETRWRDAIISLVMSHDTIKKFFLDYYHYIKNQNEQVKQMNDSSHSRHQCDQILAKFRHFYNKIKSLVLLGGLI